MAWQKKTMFIVASVLVAAASAYWFWPKTAEAPAAEAGQRPTSPWAMPVPVRVVEAALADLRVQVKAIGTVTPLNTVIVQSRVSGPLTQLHFNEGDKVTAGQLLAEIDTADYQIQFAQAQGQLEQNTAQLKNAKMDLDLYSKLREQSSISAQQYNTQQALVAQLEGSRKSIQAQLDAAKLQLSYTKIHAPITGRLGLRRVDVGNLVQANSAEGLVTITQSSPITVVFAIPESQLQQVRNAFRSGQVLTVEAWDRAEQQLLSQGVLTTLDNQIDATTGTLRLKAEFKNEQEELFPNQFVNVRLNVSVQQGAITIPQDAVQYGSAGTYIYTIEQNRAQIRQVTLGAVDNGKVAITAGLQPGTPVVLEGLDRLRPGRAVEVIENDGSVKEAKPVTEQPRRRPQRAQ
ncbi:efflux RND transporter periplasmic adaptor subunit [Alishewanella sp. 16-MA]|uniref:Efflux RND transporter periplasmic adaptor subunit n=1 Tax=Alishewanella maricola TaxID=2795740 RepID=A0ABS8C2E8_9ALTE|nr:efflux RND transporter periplasmic adaptor subunit [Alishewanella maricola]MCB5226474.1 efflux RND transporter periplasmic adaptor subunit [Alishewanella maricola]MDP5035251.1 efflux RND transporter periplasmic adaptor subunit [Alishewanella sp.]MDP5185562.1 efflux RND transporter periplasmic adaptor subunit [Alishewanella sp.]